MRKVGWWIAMPILGLLASACGKSFTTTAAATPEGPSLSEVPALYAKSLCQAVHSCTPQFAELFFGPNDCATLMTKRIEQGLLPLLEAAVATGTMTYNPSKLDACLGQLEEQGCTALDNPYLEVCEDALGGTVDVDGECAFDGECRGDAYCKSSGACPGICTTRELAGAVCRDDAECQPSLKCFNGKCTAKIAEGGSCSDHDVGCHSGLICGSDTGTGRTCVSLETVFSKEAGESCDLTKAEWCKAGSFCAITEVGLSTSVQTCVSRARSGASCNFSVPDMCVTDEYCAGTEITTGSVQIKGTCELLPLADEPCTNKADFGKACAKDHVCVTTEAGPVCHKLQFNDKGCELDADCYSESCVDGKCAPKADCDVQPKG
jgi:hypothetical protein